MLPLREDESSLDTLAQRPIAPDSAVPVHCQEDALLVASRAGPRKALHAAAGLLSIERGFRRAPFDHDVIDDAGST